MTGATAQPRRDLGYEHVLVPGDGGATLLLLHATGGDEHQLVELGRRLAPGVTLLSPRGKELENGVTRRFFRRHSPTELDIPDLLARTDELADFIAAAAAAYGLDAGRVVALGYSNGANIAASLLLRRPGTLRGAALLRPMMAYESDEGLRLDGASVLIAAGARDPLIPAEQPERLARILAAAGADVAYRVADAGHELAPSDLADAAAWLARLTDEPAATGAGDPQAGTPPADRS
ncbi:MAG TPA: alpha/beta hydrolase [Miltoncostaeaceae bacterium]|nr:alpha/beta hydrolase [Miltoncostaeaceae bacterium]